MNIGLLLLTAEIGAVLDIVVCVFGYLLTFFGFYRFFPTSYSDSYRHWENTPTKKGKKLDAGYMFTGWTAFNNFFMLPGLLVLSDKWYQLLLGLGALFYLLIVGIRPSGIKKQITKIHVIAAKLCAVSAVVWVLTHHLYWLTLGMLVVGYAFGHFYKKGKYETLIMEAVAFLLTDIAILML